MSVTKKKSEKLRAKISMVKRLEIVTKWSRKLTKEDVFEAFVEEVQFSNADKHFKIEAAET